MKFNFRLLTLILAFLFGLFFSLPTLLNNESLGKKITMGLDLQGGLHMILNVKNDIAIASKLKSVGTTAKYILDDKNIMIDTIKTENGVVLLTLMDENDVKKATELIKKDITGITLSNQGLAFSLSLTPAEIELTKQNAVDQAVDTIRNRLDEMGLAEPTVAKQGLDQILVEVPGIKTQEQEKRVRDIISKSAHLQMMAVDESKDARVATMSEAEAKSYGDVILPDIKSPTKKYLLKDIPILDGSMLTDAKVGYDQDNKPIINFSLNGQGAKIFGDFTGNAQNIGKRMAIVLDDKVYSDPAIRERIGGGHGQISGNFTVEEAQDISIALRSGSLLAPVEIAEKRSIGASLGADSIKASSLALLFGFGAVVLFMMFYYGLAGVIANVALVVNIFLILAVMSLFGATLTLPGMAGIVLTVGIAVDSNIIINERIRELLHNGVSVKKALHDGYEKAMRAILDSNVTQILASTILYAYGTGAIKGFALTLSVGILASMLTAIVGTYGIYIALLSKIEKSKRYDLWFGLAKVK